MREYYFIRHATPENDAGSFRYSRFERSMLGDADWPLAPIGRDQAQRLAPHMAAIGVQRFISSGLRRATETAEILAEHCAVPHDLQLSELNEIAPGGLSSGPRTSIGKWTRLRLPGGLQKRFDTVLYRGLSLYHFLQWHRGRTTDGDARDEIASRIHDVLARLDALPEQRIGIVGHGYWIAFMALTIARPSLLERLSWLWIDNCSVTTVRCPRPGAYELAGFARKHASQLSPGSR